MTFMRAPLLAAGAAPAAVAAVRTGWHPRLHISKQSPEPRLWDGNCVPAICETYWTCQTTATIVLVRLTAKIIGQSLITATTKINYSLKESRHAVVTQVYSSDAQKLPQLSQLLSKGLAAYPL